MTSWGEPGGFEAVVALLDEVPLQGDTGSSASSTPARRGCCTPANRISWTWVSTCLVQLLPAPFGASWQSWSHAGGVSWPVCVQQRCLLDLCEVTSVHCTDKTSDWNKTYPGERSVSCAECIDSFCTSHKYSAANSSGYKTKTYMILLSAKDSCCHLNSPQSETLPNQQFFLLLQPTKFLGNKITFQN